MVLGGLAVIAAALYVEARVAVEPIIPLRLFKDRTTSLATAASVLIGVSMFGSTVYLSEYFQIARGMSPTEAGLMSIAMVGGLLVSSIVTGRIISDTGLWKRYLVGGMVLVVIGLALLGTIDESTPLVEVGAFMARPRPRPRRHDAEPGARGPEQHRAGRHGRGQLGGRRSSARWAARSASPRWAPLLSHQVTQKVTDGLAAMGVDRPVTAPARSPTSTRCRRRSARSTRARSARPPATCSWSRRRSRCWRWSACCSSARCRCAPRWTARSPRSSTMGPCPAPSSTRPASR